MSPSSTERGSFLPRGRRPWVLPFRERIVVQLAPGALRAVRLAGGRGRVLDQRSWRFPERPVPAWANCIDALTELFDEPHWLDHPIRVLLSGAFAHHVVMPGGKALTATLLEDLARAIFRERYGDMAREWQLRVSPAGGRPTLACGVPAAFLDALAQTCADRGTLTSVEPLLMHVFNRFRRRFSAPEGSLIVVEPARLTLASWADSEWHSVIGRAGGGEALPQMFAELAAVAMPLPGRSVWLHDPEGSARLPDAPGLALIPLPDDWPATEIVHRNTGQPMPAAPPGATS